MTAPLLFIKTEYATMFMEASERSDMNKNAKHSLVLFTYAVAATMRRSCSNSAFNRYQNRIRTS